MGDEFHNGSAGKYVCDRPVRIVKPDDIYVPDLHIDTLEIKALDFR